MKLVDALVLGTSAERRGGSSPSRGTKGDNMLGTILVLFASIAILAMSIVSIINREGPIYVVCVVLSLLSIVVNTIVLILQIIKF